MVPKKYQKYSPEYLDKGKRSLVYKFKKGRKEYVIKVKSPSSKAIERLKNEAKFLKILNKHKVGPKLVDSGKDYIVYEFVEGKFLKDIKLNKKQAIEVLKQCRVLDKLKINKLEMHHPLKHILIKKKITMIDFERCYETDYPKNVTQFINYLFRDFKVPLKLIKEYKKEQSDKNFRRIIYGIKKLK